MKCKCKPENIIPPQRVALGYTTCVECSTVQPYGCVQITYHKTGNTIQIMPKEQAKRIRKLSARRGYGTCLKNIWATAETRLKARIDAPIVNVKVQSRCKTSIDQVWVQPWHNVYKVDSTGNTVDLVLKTMEVRFLHWSHKLNTIQVG